MGFIFIILSAIAWSSAGLFNLVITTDIGTTLFWRALFGAVGIYILNFIIIPKESILSSWKFSRDEIIISILSTIAMICFISSFFFTSIANVSFTYGIMPILTMILAIIILKNRFSFVGLFCCILTIIGMIIISNASPTSDDIFGIGLMALASLFMAMLTIAAKFYTQVRSIKVIYLSAFMGAFVAVPFASFGATSMTNIAWLALYGVLNICIGFGLYMLGVKRISALSAALLGLIEIPLGPIWAWLLFNIVPSANTILGGTLIMISAFIYIYFNHLSEKRAMVINHAQN